MFDTRTETIEALAQEYDKRVAAFDLLVLATPKTVREVRKQRGWDARMQHYHTAAALRALALERDRLKEPDQ